MTNKKLLPVSSDIVSNLIREESNSKFSNSIINESFPSATYRCNTGGGGGPHSSSGNTYDKPDHKKNAEMIADSKKKAELKRKNTISEFQDKYFGSIRDDINNNIARNMVDENFEKERQKRREEFLTKTKRAYEESIVLWHQDFFIKMGENTAQEEIADGYAVILWDELDKENNTRAIIIPPAVIVGAGTGAILGGVAYLAITISSGNDIDGLELAESIVTGAVIGGLVPFLPNIPHFKVAVKWIWPDIGRDVAMTVMSFGIIGSIKKSLDISDAPVVGEMIANALLWSTGNPIMVWSTLFSTLYLPFRFLYDIYQKNKTKVTMKEAEVTKTPILTTPILSNPNPDTGGTGTGANDSIGIGSGGPSDPTGGGHVAGDNANHY